MLLFSFLVVESLTRGVVGEVGNPIDPFIAEKYFKEASDACKADAGKLWGKSLDGRMMFVDRVTREAVSNAPVPNNLFRKVRNMYVGTIPSDMLVSNTSVSWGKSRWSMIMWPLPDVKADRLNLMLHESWHRIQNEINLPDVIVDNAHLDSLVGRLWIQLEIRALTAAHKNNGSKKIEAIRDAISFRAFRQGAIPKSKQSEDRMEMHEGLAEYTGVRLSRATKSERSSIIVKQNLEFESLNSFPASFAYYTGPAYGLLLDDLYPNWQRKLTSKSSLTDLIEKKLSKQRLASNILKRASRYGYSELFKKESAREEKRLALEKKYLQLFVDGPVLKIELLNMNFSYSPSSLFPLQNYGTVYPETTISDQWGRIIVTAGALISPNFSQATVSAKDLNLNSRKANGWTLELNEGWTIALGERTGDFTLRKK